MQEWSASDGSLRRENHFKGISGLFLAPDARTLLVTSSGSCCLWDTEQWRLVREFERSPLQLYPGTLSPDGRLALAGMGNLYSDPRVALCVWDVATGAIVREVAMPGSCVASVAFHPSEPLLVAGTLTRDIYVVDTSRWQVVRQMESLGTCNMSFSPSGELVVAGETGFSVLDSHSGASLYEYQGKSDERGSDAVFSQDGRFIAWGQDDGTVGLWGVED
jgi:WD40 repeat protein